MIRKQVKLKKKTLFRRLIIMPLSHFGEFDCDSTANQFAAQSQRIRSASATESPLSRCRVAEHGKCSANVLRINFYKCRKTKLFTFLIRKQVKLKKKPLFRRLIKLITSDKDINFSDSFNLAANKKHEHCPKNQNRKEK